MLLQFCFLLNFFSKCYQVRAHFRAVVLDAGVDFRKARRVEGRPSVLAEACQLGEELSPLIVLLSALRKWGDTEYINDSDPWTGDTVLIEAVKTRNAGELFKWHKGSHRFRSAVF